MAAEAPAVRAFGLVKTPAVLARLARQPAEQRAGLEDALAGLCADPRPAGSQPSALRLRGHDVYELKVQAEAPGYLVLYVVNEAEARVTVVAVEKVLV
jgi:hypothetical protein